MMNQEQYHSAQSEKWSDKPDPATGWSGVTKATPLKEFPPEGTFDSLISRYIFFLNLQMYFDFMNYYDDFFQNQTELIQKKLWPRSKAETVL